MSAPGLQQNSISRQQHVSPPPTYSLTSTAWSPHSLNRSTLHSQHRQRPKYIL